ncbi:MAG: sugar phosphate isomerase/epimerase [Acidobacteriaceae bacterium]|nr:sugar phosphate isomerase/epimerase [Acidobacteriaceae bacterium]
MQDITPSEIGLVFWAEQNSNDAAGQIQRQLTSFGLSAGQLGVPPELACDTGVEAWAAALKASQIAITSAVCSYQGEDYSDLATVHKTVGFTTSELRADRIARTQAVSDFAHALGISAVSCHIGFIPSDSSEKLYAELCELTQGLCDYCGSHGQNFVLETGQESAEVLLAFIRDVARTNLKVNFDPANMIMYDSGDPLAALDILSPHVVSAHCKDATSPVAGSGLLGTECKLGDGKVDFPAFLAKLKAINYRGLLAIEREEPNLATRTADVHTAISRLKQWQTDLDTARA